MSTSPIVNGLMDQKTQLSSKKDCSTVCQEACCLIPPSLFDTSFSPVLSSTLQDGNSSAVPIEPDHTLTTQCLKITIIQQRWNRENQDACNPKMIASKTSIAPLFFLFLFSITPFCWVSLAASFTQLSARFAEPGVEAFSFYVLFYPLKKHNELAAT